MKFLDKVKELKDDRRLRIVFFVLIFVWSIYYVMTMFFVMGELYVCDNMNGTLVSDDSGMKVCIDAVSVPVCSDAMGGVVRDNSFNYSITII